MRHWRLMTVLTVLAVAAAMLGYACAQPPGPTSAVHEGRREHARGGQPRAPDRLGAEAARVPGRGMGALMSDPGRMAAREGTRTPGLPRSMAARYYARRPMGPEDADRMLKFVGMVQRMKQVCFDPQAAGILAAGGLRDDVRRKTAEIAKDLEAQLAKTKTLGLRNAIRLTLREVYKRQDDDEKVLEHLRAMLAENDAALQAGKK